MPVPTLPNETWHRIISQFDPFNAAGPDLPALVALSRTSRQLHVVTQEFLYKEPRISTKEEAAQLTLAVKLNNSLGRTIRSLRVDADPHGGWVDFDGEALVELMRAVREGLEELDLCGVDTDLLPDVLSIPNNLRRVILTRCCIQAPSSRYRTPPSNAAHRLVIKGCRFSARSLPPHIFEKLASFSYSNGSAGGMTTDPDLGALHHFWKGLPSSLVALRILLHDLWSLDPESGPSAYVPFWADAIRRNHNLTRVELDWRSLIPERDNGNEQEELDQSAFCGLLKYISPQARIQDVVFYLSDKVERGWRENLLDWSNHLLRHPNQYATLKKIRFIFESRYGMSSYQRDLQQDTEMNLTQRGIKVIFQWEREYDEFTIREDRTWGVSDR